MQLMIDMLKDAAAWPEILSQSPASPQSPR